MKKNIYVLNENNEIDSYLLDIDEERINKLINQMEIETNKGELIHTEGTYAPYADYKGKKIDIFLKKRLDDKSIILDYDFDDVVPYYRFSFYAYEENKIVQLAKDILNEENSLNLSCDIAKLFNEYYKLANSEKHSSDELFLLEIINSIRFKNEDEIKNNKSKIAKLINFINNDEENKKNKSLTDFIKEYGVNDSNNINHSLENISESIPQKKLMF